jgi:alpha-L-fucosidase
MKKLRSLATLLLACGMAVSAQTANHPDRIEWFRDQGFGLFIHWGVDSQIGSVISHSMVGASEDYLTRFLNDLPKTFNPRKFHPQDWAVLAHLAGIRYVVFTAKHHAGFCMFATKTTDFGVEHTPFHRDIVGETLAAFREQGIAPGLYFSPDDFWWLHRNGKPLQRHTPEVAPANNPGLMEHDLTQVRELLTNYGNIDVMFFDGPPEGLRELAWKLQPNIVVTRGAIETPEQYVPGVPLEGAWESNLTMGTQWQYKPTNDTYKSGTELISTLIETRAKGGNLLLNVGPKPDGELPIEQEERLREIALWMFLNGESIYGVRPWVITNENDYWFTKKKDGSALYVAVKAKERWKYGEWKDIVLKSVRATPKTVASVLGQNDQVLEYQPGVVPKTTWKQESEGLHVRAMHAQRIYNDRKWPNPIVLKLTNVEPALQPPVVLVSKVDWNAAARTATLTGEVKDLGGADRVEAGFEYRNVKGLDITERPDSYKQSGLQPRTSPGPFTVVLKDWKPGDLMELRAVVQHPLITTYSKEQRFTVP